MTSCGFDSLPTQVTTRRTIHGLAFNLLVVGPTGIGKTTLINSLFDFDYGDSPDYERGISDVELLVKEYRPQNKTIEMKLTIIETKGFNNQLDRSEIYKPVVDYIEARYEDYLRDELRVLESKYNDIADSRVHCCIYMISPTTRKLKPIDLVTMKKLHQRVCLIPVIGRSDSLTKNERDSIKRSIMKEITENGIKIYSASDFDLPFAVSASDDIIEDNGKRQRVRCFPWGRMYIDSHSDFPALRDLLLRSNMLSLIDTTNKVHYEKYRKEATKEFQDFFDYKLKCEEEKAMLQKEIDRHSKLSATVA
ncbi:septin-8-B isoform X1 [Olea europaea subsp. europaea]|uniref:Septin-8-B isoform X1 n=1 Tax=Olea europaea subsp. europaea TaxID=158383 RepID=A0A8S0TKK5_OLEEU|nr:septin-8-B isoform X1 [Olea europaea subsp. europaea]